MFNKTKNTFMSTTVITNQPYTYKEYLEAKAFLLKEQSLSVRVVDFGDHYKALEKAAYLQAAESLGMLPELIVLSKNLLMDATTFDWYKPEDWGCYLQSAGSLAGAFKDFDTLDFSNAE